MKQCSETCGGAVGCLGWICESVWIEMVLIQYQNEWYNETGNCKAVGWELGQSTRIRWRFIHEWVGTVRKRITNSVWEQFLQSFPMKIYPQVSPFSCINSPRVSPARNDSVSPHKLLSWAPRCIFSTAFAFSMPSIFIQDVINSYHFDRIWLLQCIVTGLNLTKMSTQ